MSTVARRTRSDGAVIVGIGILWLVAYFGARALLASNAALAPAARIAVALLPAPLSAWFLWRFIKGLRSADELERRIHLEALAVAFPLGVLLLQTLALLQRAVMLEFEDWSYAHVWIYFPLFYLFGLALARKRYA